MLEKNANVNQFAVEKLKTKLRHWYAHKLCIIWLKIKKLLCLSNILQCLHKLLFKKAFLCPTDMTQNKNVTKFRFQLHKSF